MIKGLRKRGLFGARAPDFSTVFNPDAPQYGAPQQPEQPQPEGHKINWMGVLADTLAGAAGQPGQYAARTYQQRDQRQAAEAQAAQAAQQREWGWQDYVKKQEYERANPDPVRPTAEQMNFEAFLKMTPEERGEFSQYKDIVTPKLVTGADGRVYPARQTPVQPIPLQNGALPPGFKVKGGSAGNGTGGFQ